MQKCDLHYDLNKSNSTTFQNQVQSLMGAFEISRLFSVAPDIVVILNLKFVVTFSFYDFSLLQRARIERKIVNL